MYFIRSFQFLCYRSKDKRQKVSSDRERQNCVKSSFFSSLKVWVIVATVS